MSKKHRDMARLKYKYGLSEQAYTRMRVKQDFSCAICFTPEEDMPQSMHVDHCHDTGKVRGLLCAHCNFMLGHAKDRPEILIAGASYLECDD